MTTTKTTVYRSDVEKAIGQAERESLLHPGLWHYVRVGTDGAVYTGCEASACYSESEYFGRKPHPVTVWTGQAGEMPGPDAGVFEWETCDEGEAEFFAVESPGGSRYGRDWCWPSEREDYPDCTVPMKRGDLFEPDHTDAVESAVSDLEKCDWLEVE